MVVTLIGYRATGKSAVGRALAARLGWDFADSDAEIIRSAGKSISEIFSEDGEPVFRNLERTTLAELLERERLVVASGGGAIENPETRTRMHLAGPVIWLQASVDTIVERLQSDAGSAGNRPSLTGREICQEVAEVLGRREPLYGEIATLSISTDHLSIDAIVEQLLSQLTEILHASRNGGDD